MRSKPYPWRAHLVWSEPSRAAWPVVGAAGQVQMTLRMEDGAVLRAASFLDYRVSSKAPTYSVESARRRYARKHRVRPEGVDVSLVYLTPDVWRSHELPAGLRVRWSTWEYWLDGSTGKLVKTIAHDRRPVFKTRKPPVR